MGDAEKESMKKDIAITKAVDLDVYKRQEMMTGQTMQATSSLQTVHSHSRSGSMIQA